MADKGSTSNIWRATISAGLASGLLFAVCWIGAKIGVPVTHQFISLFTPQPIASAGALADGIFASALFGALAGFLVSAIYRYIPIKSVGCCQ